MVAHVCRYVSVEPAYFTLYVMADDDPRVRALARGQRVEVAGPLGLGPLGLLWAPEYVASERIRHRGPIAVALDLAAHDGSPELWLDGRPFVFQRAGAAGAVENPVWLEQYLAGRRVWFTYDGASLHVLCDARVEGDGRLIVDIERVVG